MHSKAARAIHLDRVIAVIVFGLLLFSILAGTSEQLHSQMLKLGSQLWGDYFILRTDIPAPTCNRNINIPQRLKELQAEFDLENQDNQEFDLLAESFDPASARNSLLTQQTLCAEKFTDQDIYQSKITSSIILFRGVEHSFSDFSLFAIHQQKLILMALLLLCVSVATLKKEHFSFRVIKTKKDHYLSNSAQLIGNASLSLSTYLYYRGSLESGTDIHSPEILILIIVAGSLLSFINLYRLINAPVDLHSGGSLFKSLLCIPIYSFMLLAAANHFFVKEGHFPGIAIYFTQFFQLTGLYLKIALYIWTGMLLKETQLGAKLFKVFTPWKLPPEALAIVAIILMAVPTAYTGASGIIIIAVGAVVYKELRRVGTRRQLALAVTAMTGSAGVVLRPCLLVIAIAMLNKEVVSDELFHWGNRVFMLTLLVFAFFVLITRKQKLEVAGLNEALLPSLKLLKPLVPYVLIFIGFITFYHFGLNARLDEFSAPIMLPIMLIAVIIYEKRSQTKDKNEDEENIEEEATSSVRTSLSSSIRNASIQIGALLIVMASSYVVGGIIERGDGIMQIPDAFSSSFAAMGFLVFFLIIIGMIMDPFGALILVSGTIAPVAYKYGINPIHFWMTCLVAFELGYLSPPVSLNHLLTRQVVGDKEITLAMQEGDSFYYRHERLILPILVMGTTLLLVAFVPLLFAN